ncbi:MAG: flavodoxin [Ruminococcus sp.]|nr:flavodoxin [Ruminococcus sp.]
MNTIVIYFSRADENYFGGSMRYVQVGNTEIAVQHITELTGFDSFKLEMVQPYSAEYMTCIDEAKAHLRDSARPELKEIPDVSGYDSIILAYPNYWGTAPMAVFTFLDNADLSDKTIYPLCTNEGSGLGKSVSDIKKYANVGEGLSLSGSTVKNAKPQIEKWLKNNHII